MNTKIPVILIIDDADSHLYLLQSILSEEGYNVIIENDAQNALVIMDEINFDLILLDLMMPKIDGFTILEIIKTNYKNKNIPVIMVSAKSDIKSIERSIREGAHDYIVKPVNIRDVKNKIKSALNNY
ncbi:MAG: response regulator [Bacteroidales bacterium]|nr:response regulator [Bacteroidales bacterium]